MTVKLKCGKGNEAGVGKRASWRSHYGARLCTCAEQPVVAGELLGMRRSHPGSATLWEIGEQEPQ